MIPNRATFEKLLRMARPKSGFLYTDARFLAVRTELDTRRAQAWIPGGIRLEEPGRATVFVARFESSSFGSVYSEAGIFLHVQRGSKSGVFCPWMVVDDDVALILGRDALAYPQKIADIDVRFEEARVTGKVVRRGATLLELHATLGDALIDPPPVLGQPTWGVLGGIGLDIGRLVTYRIREQVKESRHAFASLALGHSERDPLGDIGVGRVLDARSMTTNIGGGLGSIPQPVGLVSPTFFVQHHALRCL